MHSEASCVFSVAVGSPLLPLLRRSRIEGYICPHLAQLRVF